MQGRKTAYSGWICDFLLEREHLLSKIPGNRTVEILRSKMESRSTRRVQRVVSVSRSFDKLRDVGDLSYLVYFCFKCFDR